MFSGVPKWAWNAKLSSHSHNLSHLHPAKTRLKHNTVDKIIGFWSLKSHDLQTLQFSSVQLFNIMIKCNKTRCRRQNHCFSNVFWRAEVGLKRETLITFSQFIPPAPCQNTPETRYCRQNHCFLHVLEYRNQPETRSSYQILTCYHACTLPKQPWNTMLSTKS